MLIPCEFVAGLCSNCGDSERGECEGWNPPEAKYQELMAAAKLALKAMNSLHVECRSFHHGRKDQMHELGECPPQARFEAAIEALRQAGVQ